MRVRVWLPQGAKDITSRRNRERSLLILIYTLYDNVPLDFDKVSNLIPLSCVVSQHVPVRWALITNWVVTRQTNEGNPSMNYSGDHAWLLLYSRMIKMHIKYKIIYINFLFMYIKYPWYMIIYLIIIGQTINLWLGGPHMEGTWDLH